MAPTPESPISIYAGLADNYQLAKCPMINAPGVGPMTMRDWLRHWVTIDIWTDVVRDFYATAAAIPSVADHFRNTDMEQLPRHFLAALMIVTNDGISVGVVRRMYEVHRDLRTSNGAPIDQECWDHVTGALVSVLLGYGTPASAITDLANALEPIRQVVVIAPKPATVVSS